MRNQFSALGRPVPLCPEVNAFPSPAPFVAQAFLTPYYCKVSLDSFAVWGPAPVSGAQTGVPRRDFESGLNEHFDLSMQYMGGVEGVGLDGAGSFKSICQVEKKNLHGSGRKEHLGILGENSAW